MLGFSHCVEQLAKEQEGKLKQCSAKTAETLKSNINTEQINTTD